MRSSSSPPFPPSPFSPLYHRAPRNSLHFSRSVILLPPILRFLSSFPFIEGPLVTTTENPFPSPLSKQLQATTRERERGRESFSPSLSRLFVCSSSVILVISLAMILLSVRFSESLKRGWRHFSYELSMIFDRGYWIRFLYLLSQWREKVGNSKEWFYGERERYKQG